MKPLGVDDRGLDRRRVVAARGQRDPEEVDLAAERLAARLAVDEQDRHRRGRPRRAGSPRRRPASGRRPRRAGRSSRWLPGSSSVTRNVTGASPARRDRPDHLARPRRGLAVDEQLDRPGQRPGAGVGDGRRDRRRQARHEGRARHFERRRSSRRPRPRPGRRRGRSRGPRAGGDRAVGRGGRGAAPSGRARRAARPTRWPSVRTMTSRAGFPGRSRMRNASATAAERSLDPRAGGAAARAASTLARSKLGGSTSGRTRSLATSTATESPGPSPADERPWPRRSPARGASSRRRDGPCCSTRRGPAPRRDARPIPPSRLGRRPRRVRRQNGRASASATSPSRAIRASISSDRRG